MNDITGQFILEFSPATRISHPDTSRNAERKITKSGKRKTHCTKILKELRRHNGSTTKELAVFLEGVLTHAQIWRRMNDLVENEHIKRNDNIVRDGFCTWRIL